MDGLRRTCLVISLILVLPSLLLLFLTDILSLDNLLFAFLILFGVSYILLYFVLDRIFFHEIKDVSRILSESKKMRVENILLDRKNFRIKAFRQLFAKLYKHLYRNQKRIDHLSRLAAFRKEFVADVSHELKTPIFAAQGFVHTLLDGAVEDKEVRTRFLEKAAKSLDSLDLLVHDLLTLSNIEIGETKMQFEYFSINDLVQEVIDQFGDRAKKKKKVKVRIVADEPDMVVYADWLRIRQALTNLISNAIKYSEEKGEVEVALVDEEDYVLLQVKDNGVGIPEKDLNRVFERFYRVDKSRSREKGGTGLGLAIVKHIVESHHSMIEVKSKQGEGSTFEFKLPKGKEVMK